MEQAIKNIVQDKGLNPLGMFEEAILFFIKENHFEQFNVFRIHHLEDVILDIIRTDSTPMDIVIDQKTSNIILEKGSRILPIDSLTGECTEKNSYTLDALSYSTQKNVLYQDDTIIIIG